MRTTRTTTLQQLYDLSLARKAVLTREGHRIPAAFMIGCPGFYILRHIRAGLYRYVPKSKKRSKST